LRCDPVDLQQIFYNIMRNAAEALHRAPVERCTINVLTRKAVTASEQAVQIVVSDEGTGFPSEIREEVLGEPPAGGDVTHGIGLPTVIYLLRRLGGRISFDDREGGGTVVTITLPVTAARGDESS
jgi:signal transduction histidine kinase